jgi:hypothetical protein
MNTGKKLFHLKFSKAEKWGILSHVDIDVDSSSEQEGRDLSETAKTDRPSAVGFKGISGTFVHNMEAFFVSMPFIMLMAQTHIEALIQKDLKDACSKHAVKIEERDFAEIYSLEYSAILMLSPILDKILVAGRTMEMIPMSLVMQLSSQFDVLIGLHPVPKTPS